MKTFICPIRSFLLLAFLLTSLVRSHRAADQIELENGDRYIGKLLSVTESEIQIQSEINGVMKLPRSKVVAIYFRNPPKASAAAPAATGQGVEQPGALTKDILARIQNSGVDSETLNKVQNDLLASAGPEAQKVFTETLNALKSGKMNLEDLRRQARESVKQLNEFQKDLGEDYGDLLNGYVSILQKFLQEDDSKQPPKSKE